MLNARGILLFNVNVIKQSQINELCKDLSIAVRVIYRPQYGEYIGTLAGLGNIKAKGGMYLGEGFGEEMLVFCGFDSDALDEFLQKYRDAGIAPIALKAMLTPFNARWTAVQLYAELKKEHNALH